MVIVVIPPPQTHLFQNKQETKKSYKTPVSVLHSFVHCHLYFCKTQLIFPWAFPLSSNSRALGVFQRNL